MKNSKYSSMDMAKNNGIHVQYSLVNQAWFVMWHESVLHVFNNKEDADTRAEELIKG